MTTKIFVLVRKAGSFGFQAVQAARALSYFYKKYPEDQSDNIILLEMPPGGLNTFFVWENLFDANNVRYTASCAYFKHDANILRTAIAAGSEAEPFVKYLRVFGHEIRKKPDLL